MKKILLIMFLGLFQNFIFGAIITNTSTDVNGNLSNLKGRIAESGFLPSGKADFVFAPSAPTGLNYYSVSCSGATIQWNWQASSPKFYLDVATTSTFAAGTIVSTYDNKDLGNVYSTSLIGLNANTIYYFRLRAWDSSGYSDYSSSGSFTTSAVTAPTNIRAESISCSGYIAKWDGSATKFYIDVATTSTFATGTILSDYNNYDVGSTNSITLSGLNPATTYYFRVRRLESCGLSDNSVVGNGTTLSIAAPTNTRSDNVNWCTSTIRWDGSATKFYLDVATSNTFSAGTILPAYNNLDVGNVNVLTLSGLLTNTTYYFRVRRLESCGLSGNSPVSNFTTMSIASPTANTGFASCNDWVAQWNKIYNTSGNGADGYYLDLAIDSNFTNYVSGYQNLYVGDVNAYTLTGLARGGIYYYRLRAVTSCGLGGNSNVVSFTEKGNNSSTPGTISGGATSICKGANTTFMISGSNPSNGIWSIFNQTGSATITQGGVVTGVSSGTVLVVFTTYNGCGTSTSQPLTINGGTVSAASSTATVCINTAISPSITHTTSGFSTISDSGVSGANGLPTGVSASFSSNTITISGTPTVAGKFNYNIQLTGTSSCGTSTGNAIGTITVRPVFTSGTISNTGETICTNTVPTATIGSTTASSGGDNTITYQWQYSTDSTFATGVTTVSSNAATYKPTQTLTQTTYYRRQAKDGTCNTTFTSSANIWTVTVNSAAPATPGTITQPTNKCSGSTGNVFSVATVTGVTSYTWSVSGTGWAITAGGTTSSATITIGSGTGTVSVTATNACGTSSASTTGNIIPTTAPATPGTITQPTNTCANTSGNFSVASVSGVSYTWSVTGTGWAITAGGTTNSATITIGSGTGTVSVTATNACGTSSASTTGNIIPTTAPATPGTITQPTNTCANTSGNFSVVSVSGVSYTWSVTGTGWAITAGGTTSSATITIGSGTGTVSVTATNACGTSSASTTGNIIPTTAPATPGTITQPTNTCANTSGNFSVVSVSGVSYTWSVTGTGWAITAGGTTNSATITIGSGTGTVLVTATNACGTSSASTTGNIVPSARPTPTFTTAARSQTCSDVRMTYTTQTGKFNYTWTVSGVQNTDYILRGQGTATDNAIVIEWLTGGTKTVTVNYTNSLTGCNGATAAVYSTQVTAIDRGQLNGGRENLCRGDALPTLTLHIYADRNVVYPVDPSLVVKWQYNDDIGNAEALWYDIADPQNVVNNTSYTPQSFPGAFRTYRVVLQNGSCEKKSIQTRIKFNAFNAPTLGTTTYPTCTVSTGSVVLNDLPSGNWTLYQNGNLVTTGSGTTYTVSGLAVGTHTFTVREGSCTSDSSAVLNITQVANIWDGTKWSKTGNTTLPTADDKIVFEGNYIMSTNMDGCSCTVNSGNVVVNSGVTFTITNAVTVTGGSLTFSNNSSLVQINNVANSGAIVYQRSSAPMKNFDFTYWSSPVAGQTLFNLSPNTLWDKYFSFSGTNWVQISYGAATMDAGIGYIIRTPKGGTWPAPHPETVTFPYSQPVEFKGVPNNGNITSSQTMTTGNLYLIGNPYPCALDADEFLFTNVHNRDILAGTIYFWTHNTAVEVTSTEFKYTSDDYASYNLTGGTGTAASSSGNKTEPDGNIAAGQSFFGTAEGDGKVEFTNSMRVGGNNTQFFKPGKTSKSTKLEKHRLWLNMINSQGAYKQALIGYIEGATNSFDKSFDGLSFDGNSFIDFYSVNAADNYVIQGRALPFTDTDVVPLGYRSTIAGDFTIAIDHADGNLAAQRVYLEDKQTNTVIELTAKNYTFTTKAGTFNNRFVLKYTNRTLGTGDFETTEDAVSISVKNKTVAINSSVENIDKVFIYDVAGKQLYTKENVNNRELIMQNLPFAQQVLLVKIFLENGTITTKKVIFK